MSEPTMADLLSMRRLILDHDRGHHDHHTEPGCPVCSGDLETNGRSDR